MKKIKVFLGGITNVPNAQNYNCLSLSKLLDRDRFKVYSLLSSSHENNLPDDVDFISLPEPNRFFKYFGFLWGIFKADVCYLPRTDCFKWNQFWVKLFRKKSFRTIESIITPESLSDNNVRRCVEHYKETENLYPITKFMKEYNEINNKIKCSDDVLYLGVNLDPNRVLNHRTSIHKVVLIGNDLIRKGVYDYLLLSKSFPMIEFHIIGSGNGKINLNEILNSNHYSNVIYHGILPMNEVKTLIPKFDLMILPSHQEGFPKVILEFASYGIPSLVYSTYGANEWIDDGVDGYIVNDFFSMEKKLSEVILNSKSKKLDSRKVEELALRFSWESKVSSWEKIITEVYEN
ncbi:glycosyltransferase family 4 protein [Vibrio sp. 10N.286.49.F3]|uniref:glycosyltransferase family 4 protein n=1 Tax=Vibrio sp. 10N.286.49.F3 TaxID=3229704 RepID=UPI003550BD4B